MTFIEVRSSAPEIPEAFQDGTYPLILTEIADPKTVHAQRGKRAGQDVDLIDWTFAVDDASGPIDGLEVRTSTSTSTGPKSRMYQVLTALLGGKPPALGQKFTKADLVGRRCLGNLSIDEFGYVRVGDLVALPASMLGQPVAAATGAPLNLTPAQRPAAREAAAAPARAAVNGGVAAAAATPADELPF